MYSISRKIFYHKAIQKCYKVHSSSGLPENASHGTGNNQNNSCNHCAGGIGVHSISGVVSGVDGECIKIWFGPKQMQCYSILFVLVGTRKKAKQNNEISSRWPRINAHLITYFVYLFSVKLNSAGLSGKRAAFKVFGKTVTVPSSSKCVEICKRSKTYLSNSGACGDPSLRLLKTK